MLTGILKETPLAEQHRQSGARMVDFAGWNMPVQYQSILKEHMAVRKAIGLFDVSHMGEFVVRGKNAKAFIQKLIGNDLDRLQQPNTALYAQLVNPNGGTVDDLIVYWRPNDYLLVVNAGNIEKDWQWLKSYAPDFSDLELVDESDTTALLALQGPTAASLIKDLAGTEVANLPAFHYTESTISGIKTGLGRTGYTG